MCYLLLPVIHLISVWIMVPHTTRIAFRTVLVVSIRPGYYRTFSRGRARCRPAKLGRSDNRTAVV